MLPPFSLIGYYRFLLWSWKCGTDLEANLCLLYIEVFADVELAVQCIIVQRSGLEILFVVYNF